VSGNTGVAGGFDETIIEAVSHVDGILLATPVLEVTTVLNQNSSPPVTLPILGVDLLAESSVRDYRVMDADAKETDWERYLDPDAIFLGRKLAERHGLSVGMPLDVGAGALSRRLVVRGLLEGQGPGKSTLEELAVMDVAATQFTFDRLGLLDRIDLVTDPARSVDEVSRAVLVLLPPGLTVTRPSQRNVQIERMTRAFRLNVSLLSVVALLVGLFLVYNTVSFAVLRRRREVGILRSLGLSPGGIARLFLVEVVLIGLVGAVVGIGFGLALSNGALQALARTVSSLYGEVPAFPPVTWAHPAVLMQGLLIGIGVAVLGSLGPIREAVSVAPTQALVPKGYETVGAIRVVPTLAGAALIFVVAGLAALPGPVQGVPLFGYLSAFLVVL
ncbi:MAG: FtsX-like permease family protein, partial [Nitrospirota bacterium]